MSGRDPVHRPGAGGGLLARHPSLRLVIAHAGARSTPTSSSWPYPDALLPQLRDLGLAGKGFLGSDFSHIPYPFDTQIDALERLDLGQDWLRAVCWDNAARLLLTGQR